MSTPDNELDSDDLDEQPQALTLDAPIYDMIELSEPPLDSDYYAIEEQD